MKKKIIIVGAILIVLAGGLGVKHAVASFKATHASSDNEYYYNKGTSNLGDDPSATGSGAEGELPSRDEVITEPDSIYCLVNKEYSLPSDYVPEDLVEPDVTFSIDYESEKKYLRKIAADALESLFNDASEQNLELAAVSGYRSYDRQKEIYEKNLKTRGTSHTNQYSAKPGYSEHQTGLVMDISCKSENYDLQESFGETPEGKWVADNAHLYGYIIRYPEDKSEITGYAYEPWHLRYVGIDLATYLYTNHMTLDEYFRYEPSYDYITDESEYINDTPAYEGTGSSTPSYSQTPSYSASPSSVPGSTSNNSSSAQPSKAPVTSKAPATSTPSTKPSPQVSAVPQTSEKPVASAKPSVKPSKVPSAAPSHVPSPEPSAVAPSKEPHEPDNGDDGSSDGSAESVE